MSRAASALLAAFASVAATACQTIDERAPPGFERTGAAAIDGGAGSSSGSSAGAGDAGSDGAASPTFDAGDVPDVGPATQVVAGYEHACALSRAGAVMCWGSNAHGQLGRGAGGDSPVPVAVQGLGAGVTVLAAGVDHTCALSAQDAGAAVLCWGRNDHGQLGDGTTQDRSTPVAVSAVTGASALAAGGLHSCALVGGAPWCWGQGDRGQLGSGTITDSTVPVAVGSLAGVIALAAGGAHTCAIAAQGAVQCWGNDDSGQLGDGTHESRAIPVAVAGLTQVATAITAGNAHTCARTTGGVMCWGYGQYGQLGNGATSDSPTPVSVRTPAAGLGAGGIGAGGQQSCALDGQGGAFCWGEDASGQLGDDGASDRAVPVPVLGVSAGASCIAGGVAHTCAVVAGGHVQCWGWNVSGQLGNGTRSDSASPVTVPGF